MEGEGARPARRAGPSLSWRLVEVAGLHRTRPGTPGRHPPPARQSCGLCPRHPGSGRSHNTGHTRDRRSRFLLRVPCLQARGPWHAKAPRERTWEQVSSRCRSLVGPFATCHSWAWYATAADMSLRPMCGGLCRARTAATAVPSVYPDVALGNPTSRSCRTGKRAGVVGAALVKWTGRALRGR